MKIESERLVLESISPDLAQRIVAGDRTDDDNWQVVFDYGLVASARGAGLATETVHRALEVAARHGALSATADTDLHNRPSQ
jgi:RimJ/RimL family protein N-acetyltransferase